MFRGLPIGIIHTYYFTMRKFSKQQHLIETLFTNTNLSLFGYITKCITTESRTFKL